MELINKANDEVILQNEIIKKDLKQTKERN